MEKEKVIKKCTACKIIFAVALLVSIVLIVVGFIIPPKGVIDGSVLKAVGELFAYAALAFGGYAITLGYDLKVSKGETMLELSDNGKNKEEK